MCLASIFKRGGGVKRLQESVWHKVENDDFQHEVVKFILETEDIIENMATADIAEGQIFTRAALEAIQQGIQEVYSSRGKKVTHLKIETIKKQNQKFCRFSKHLL